MGGDGPAIVAHQRQVRFHCRPLAVPGGGTIQDEKAFLVGVPLQGIPQSLLKIKRSLLVSLHDLADKSLPTVAPGLRVVLGPGQLGQHILRAVFMKLSCCKVKGSVQAVVAIRLAIEIG